MFTQCRKFIHPLLGAPRVLIKSPKMTKEKYEKIWRPLVIKSRKMTKEEYEKIWKNALNIKNSETTTVQDTCLNELKR
jgi:hypothetical protein